jgi:hypothetical protein
LNEAAFAEGKLGARIKAYMSRDGMNGFMAGSMNMNSRQAQASRWEPTRVR